MSVKFFLDTNIIVYSFDISSSSKQEAANKLIQDALLIGKGIISYQVLQEFINFALKTKVRPMTLDQIRRYCSKVLRPLCAVHSSAELYQKALSVKEYTKFSWYDSLIVASALESGCEILYSEDLQHKRKIEGLSIINPFA